MKKTIIAVWGTANVGKSKTLIKLGNIIKNCGWITENNVSKNNDYWAVFKYKGITLGVETYGDVEDDVGHGLQGLIGAKCDIIVMTSKTYGGTVNAIGELSSDPSNDYRVLWITPIQVNDGQTDLDLVNGHSARHLKQMIEDIIELKL